MQLSKHDFTLGAIYLLGARRRFDRETLVRLLIDRASFKRREAEQLAAHWLGTEKYRKAA